MPGALRIEEVNVGRSPYQSEKRRKELARLKKQEEKRQRRFNKKHEGEAAEGQAEGTPAVGETEAGGPAGAPMENVSSPDSGHDTTPSKEGQEPGRPS